MAAANLKKVSKSAKASRSTASEERTPRRLNRVGTHIEESFKTPATVGERMATRRLELQLRQDEVADAVVFTPKSGARKGEKSTLSRTAYCMYETGSVIPKNEILIGIADALQTTPQWLAFGVEEPNRLQEYSFDEVKGAFKKSGGWSLSEEWVRETYNMPSSELALFVFNDDIADYEAGEVAILHHEDEPTNMGGKYILLQKKVLKVAYITKRPRSDSLRVFSADMKSHEEVQVKNVTILGRVLGRITPFDRSAPNAPGA